MNLREQIREGVKERMRPQLVFKGLRESDVVPLKEHVRMHGNDCAWGSQRLSESEEYEEDEESPQMSLSGDQLKTYRPGDIIMPKEIYSPKNDTPVDEHRVLLIDISERDQYGIAVYKGFLLSSKKYKSNIYEPKRYPNNIWFQDFSTLLRKGPMNDHKEGFINVTEIVEFNSEDLATSGVWKGHASDKLFHFINNCYTSYKEGRSNAYEYWFGPQSLSKKEYFRRVAEVREKRSRSKYKTS